MKLRNILTLFAAVFVVINSVNAEEITPILTARQRKQVILEQIQPNITDDCEEIIMPEENVDPVFRPYELQKDEVIFNNTKAWINAINPTAQTNKVASSLPGARGTNQLIIYTPSYGTKTGTNEFGQEAIVVGNTVTELSGADSLIPPDGLVISGHGRAKSWINSSIKIGTKIYIDKDNNFIYAYTTSESYIFESEKKISEAEQMLNYYRLASPEYNWKVPSGYINDAKNYLKKAQKNPDEVQKYSQLAIDAANDALKSVIPYKNGELKGIWLRPTETSEDAIITTLNRLNKTGIDTVFLETYFHGKTIFPSITMKDYGFTEQYETFKGIDPLEIWIREAHKRSMKIHVWFETFYVGNQPPNDNPNSILAKNPSWGNKIKKDINTVSPSRASSEHNGYFLDPANPQVQNFLTKLTQEIISRYKPDGINIDYIRYPNSVSNTSLWGFTDYARNEFNEIYGIDPADLTKYDPLWLEWNNYRRDKITSMVKKFGQLGRQTNTYISAVIFPDREAAYNQKMQDWKTWTTREFINGFTPLLLTCDSKTANKMMTDVLKVKSPNTDFYAGLFVTFMNGSDEDLIRQIHESRKNNAKGVILFDYAHLNNKYINTLSASVFAKNSPIKTQNNYPSPQLQRRKGWWVFSAN